MTWAIDAPQGFESGKIKYLLPQYTRGRVLELGCGTKKTYDHFIGLDSGNHWGKGAADIVADASDLSMFSDNSFDAVFSSHVLEHLADIKLALTEWSRIIKVGGHLCLYVPSGNLYPKVGEEGANPTHKFDIYPGDIESNLPGGWIVKINEERDMGNEYSILFIAEKSNGGEITVAPKPDKKTVCLCRYGGFGDALQAATVFPRLKEQGYHLAVMTTPECKNIIENDPYVDEWILQDKDQVPNHELCYFWSEQEKRFDKFINLSESIEGTLLALPARTNHAWPHHIRHRHMNRNYFDWTAELADVDFKPCKQFYPTDAENATAKRRLKDGVYNIVWALAGSSIHKFYPHMDAVIARIMLDIPNCNLIFTGDLACQILEQGWTAEPRIQCLSGLMSIRDTLALACLADLVVGPETGVLNAVAHESNGKAVFLSHSSKKNLTQHWYNTETLVPEGVDCYPCHMIHHGDMFCNLHEESSSALCQWNISPAKAWESIKRLHDKWRKK